MRDCIKSSTNGTCKPLEGEMATQPISMYKNLAFMILQYLIFLWSFNTLSGSLHYFSPYQSYKQRLQVYLFRMLDYKRNSSRLLQIATVFLTGSVFLRNFLPLASIYFHYLQYILDK